MAAGSHYLIPCYHPKRCVGESAQVWGFQDLPRHLLYVPGKACHRSEPLLPICKMGCQFSPPEGQDVLGGGGSMVESVTPRSGYDCHHSSLPDLSGTLGQINPMFPRGKYTHSHNHLLLGNFYTQLPPHQKKKVLCSVRQPGLQRP